MKVRFKHDYLKLINDHGLRFEFADYANKHRNISINRAARAFCAHHDLIKFSEWKILEKLNLPLFDWGEE